MARDKVDLLPRRYNDEVWRERAYRFIQALGLEPRNVKRQKAQISGDGGVLTLLVFRYQPHPATGKMSRAVCTNPCTCKPRSDHPHFETDTVDVPLVVNPADYELALCD